MKLIFKIKHHFFGAFREFFVYHYDSLEFRAKIFALIISANQNPSIDNYILVKKIANKIYKNDVQRADILMLSTKEIVQKVKENSSLSEDKLIFHIQKQLKKVPRYAKKINIEDLKLFLDISDDEDVIAYQKNIIEFLSKLKKQILSS